MVSASQTPAATSAIASRFERVLQPVADEARNVLLDVHRLPPGVAQQLHGPAHGVVAGLFVLDHLDQRHQMRRIPEMRADHAVAMLELRADLGRGNGRAVAGEDGVRRGQAFQLGEQLLLERQLLRRGLEHEGDVLHRRRHLVVRRDAAEQRGIAAEQVAGALQPLRQRFAPFGRRIVDADGVAGRRQQIGDAVAHQARADHADIQAAHAIPLQSGRSEGAR